MSIGINLSDETNYYSITDNEKLNRANILLKKCKKLLNKRMHIHLRIALRKEIEQYLNL